MEKVYLEGQGIQQELRAAGVNSLSDEFHRRLHSRMQSLAARAEPHNKHLYEWFDITEPPERVYQREAQALQMDQLDESLRKPYADFQASEKKLEELKRREKNQAERLKKIQAQMTALEARELSEKDQHKFIEERGEILKLQDELHELEDRQKQNKKKMISVLHELDLHLSQNQKNQALTATQSADIHRSVAAFEQKIQSWKAELELQGYSAAERDIELVKRVVNSGTQASPTENFLSQIFTLDSSTTDLGDQLKRKVLIDSDPLLARYNRFEKIDQELNQRIKQKKADIDFA